MVLVAFLFLTGLQAASQQTPQRPPAEALKAAPGNPVAVIATNKGDITVELFKDRAPVSVANFLEYARAGFYAGTVFHRIERGFVIQGGGFTASLEEKPTRDPILNEATNGLRNVRGTLGVARRTQLRSATSQFYINVGNNSQLDHRGYTPSDFGYAVFGRVLSGMDVVDQIANTRTRRVGSFASFPVEPIVIIGVTVRDAQP
jgi:cyclophilin family peptidyl-prolyl cis-trans isomerase